MASSFRESTEKSAQRPIKPNSAGPAREEPTSVESPPESDSGAKKVVMVGELFELALALKIQALKSRLPDIPEKELRQMALESIERGTR